MRKDRKIVTLFALIFLAMAPIILYAYEYGPDPGYTNAPGDNATACQASGCHVGNFNPPGGSVKIVASGGTTYVPGQVQTITVTITDPTKKRYGFELSARVDSNPNALSAGMLRSADTLTEVIDCNSVGYVPFAFSCVAGKSLQWISHNLSGYTASNSTAGSYTYKFLWTPPPTAVGSVTFYAAGTAVTGTLVPTGTNTYTTSLQLSLAAEGTPTNTVLTTSPNPSTFGQPVTLTASVSSPSAGVPSGSGNVTFYDGTSVLGTTPVTNGQASLSSILLPAGARSLKAYYVGNSIYAASTSTAITETVNTSPSTTFHTAINYAPGGSAFSVAIGDFNADGKPDVAFSDGANKVAVLMGNGDGTFKPAVLYAVGSAPVSIVAGDFNGDGKTDLAVANELGSNVSLLLGNGDGTFQKAVNYEVGGTMLIAAADFNQDGRADLVTINRDGNVSILFGVSDGTFYAAGNLAHGIISNSVAIADLNSDGKADLALMNSCCIVSILGNGDGTFQPGVLYNIGRNLGQVITGDFNGDGKIDLAVVFGGGSVGMLLGNGDGTFLPLVTYAAGSDVNGLTVGDINGDGKLDLIAVNAGVNGASNTASVLLGNGDGTFQSPVSYGIGTNSPPVAVAVGDFNGDGRSDLAVAGLGGLGIMLGANPTQLQFIAQPVNSNVGVAQSVAVQVQDPSGVVDPDWTSPVTLTSSPVGVTATVSPVSGVATFNNLTFNAAGTYTLTASSPGLTSATSNSFTIGTVPQCTVTLTPSSLQAPASGTTGSFAINANSSNCARTVKSNAGWISVAFGQTGNGTSGSAGYTVDNNTLRTSRTGTISVTTPSSVSNFTVNQDAYAGNATKLFFAAQPSNANVGTAMPQILVQLQDTFGNLVTGTSQTVTIASTPAGVSATVSAVNGVATFSNLVFTTPGTYTFTATSAGLTPATSNSFSVVTAVAPSVVIDSPAPGAVLASGSFTISGWAIDNTTSAIGTAINNVLVKIDGVAVGNATYGLSRPDVCGAYPGRIGCPNVGYALTVNTATLSLGTHVITVSATDTDLTPDTATASVTVMVPDVPPLVAIDAPQAGSAVSGAIAVSGWAVNTSPAATAITSVQVKVDGTPVGNAIYGTPRPDVCTVYPGAPGCSNVGYVFVLNTTRLTPGSHTLTVSATDTDGVPDIGSRSITINVTSGAPLVFVDNPMSGATLSGNAILTGWALDNGLAAGTPLASVQVKVDGNLLGNAAYGTPRADVCGVYPGRPNCPNVGWTYTLDTTRLTNGTHTLSVIATDTDSSPDAGSWAVAISVANQISPPPMVYMDSSVSGALSGFVTLSGWAIDNALAANGTQIASVQIKVDGALVGNAFYGDPRPDVCAVFPLRIGCPNVGWSYSLDTTKLSNGTHTLTVVATDSDGTPDSGSFTTTITVSQGSPPPLVVIDTPATGSVLPSVVAVTGWAIDSVLGVGTPIVSVQLKVDGAVVGNATYGINRPDVCFAYPGRPNCPNVGFSYSLNTSGLAPGSHTISVIATDSDAAPDGASASVTVTK